MLLIDPGRAGDAKDVNRQQSLQLQKNHNALVDMIECNDRLLSQLHAHGCLTRLQLDYIKNADLRAESNRRLLDLLRRRDQSDFDSFILSFQNANRKVIADLLLGSGSVVPLVSELIVAVPSSMNIL